MNFFCSSQNKFPCVCEMHDWWAWLRYDTLGNGTSTYTMLNDWTTPNKRSQERPCESYPAFWDMNGWLSRVEGGLRVKSIVEFVVHKYELEGSTHDYYGYHARWRVLKHTHSMMHHAINFKLPIGQMDNGHAIFACEFASLLYPDANENFVLASEWFMRSGTMERTACDNGVVCVGQCLMRHTPSLEK